MPLNYSKWDNLELSDDSDVEVHPNVDKRSFIRWKQRDIHEKRALRKAQQQALEAEHQTSQTLLPILEELKTKTASSDAVMGHKFFSRRVAQLTAERDERAARGEVDNDHPTIDDMILSLMLQIEAADGVKGKQGSELDAALVQSLTYHKDRLEARDREVLEELDEMAKEDSKKITSESIHDAFNTGYVSKAEREANEAKEAKAKAAQEKGKSKPAPSTTIETLNSPAAKPSAASTSTSEPVEVDEDFIQEATPEMIQFAQLPSSIPNSIPLGANQIPVGFPLKELNLDAFDKVYDYLKNHTHLVKTNSNQAVDSLLLTAFESQQKGKEKMARQAVEKALLLQYCAKLGPDGVRLFFQRMTQTNGQAATVFLNDVLSTYVRIRQRSAAIAAENPPDGEEQIQLVAEDPSVQIGFQIPEGPPPEQIELQGEGFEGVTPEMVREMLQKQWEIFSSFTPEFQEALKSQDLDKVNAQLGAMSVDKAEAIVQALDEGGILNFSSNEIRDETGQ